MRLIKPVLAIMAASLLLASCAGSKGKAEIPILAWFSIPAQYASEETYQDLADAGFTINFSHLTDLNDALKALDLGQKAGVKIMFTCTQLSSDPEEIVKKVKDHPALFGYFLRDEPAASDFPGLADWAKRIRAVDDTHPIYLNLFPNYAPEHILGCTYEEYVHRFVEEVGLPMLSFDYYPVTVEGVRESWWSNLEVIAKEAKEADVSLSPPHISPTRSPRSSHSVFNSTQTWRMVPKVSSTSPTGARLRESGISTMLRSVRPGNAPRLMTWSNT